MSCQNIAFTRASKMSVGKPRGAISRVITSHAHVLGSTWHLLRCHMAAVLLDEQQMSPSDTMVADSIGRIVNQSGRANFSRFHWSELYCHLLLRSTPRRRVVCPILKLPTWLTLVWSDYTCLWSLTNRARTRTARMDISLFSLQM